MPRYPTAYVRAQKRRLPAYAISVPFPVPMYAFFAGRFSRATCIVQPGIRSRYFTQFSTYEHHPCIIPVRVLPREVFSVLLGEGRTFPPPSSSPPIATPTRRIVPPGGSTGPPPPRGPDWTVGERPNAPDLLLSPQYHSNAETAADSYTKDYVYVYSYWQQEYEYNLGDTMLGQP